LSKLANQLLRLGPYAKAGASSWYPSGRVNTRATRIQNIGGGEPRGGFAEGKPEGRDERERASQLSPANCAFRIRHLSAGESAATGETRGPPALCPQRDTRLPAFPARFARPHDRSATGNSTIKVQPTFRRRRHGAQVTLIVNSAGNRRVCTADPTPGAWKKGGAP